MGVSIRELTARDAGKKDALRGEKASQRMIRAIVSMLVPDLPAG